jgi:hypothetical protein
MLVSSSPLHLSIFDALYCMITYLESMFIFRVYFWYLKGALEDIKDGRASPFDTVC